MGEKRKDRILTRFLTLSDETEERAIKQDRLTNVVTASSRQANTNHTQKNA